MTEFHGHPDQQFGYITYAQHGDDLMILNLFRLLRIMDASVNAWLDLGAHHPTTISNTKLLYDYGYRGVNVEANPTLFPAFQRERPEDLNLQIAVGPIAGAATFNMYSDTSGRNTFSSTEVESLKGILEVKQRISLPLFTLNDIVDRWCSGIFPVLLSCDIEGLDFDTLSATDFSNHPPLIICVETRRKESGRMTAMLERKGFLPYCRMGENLFFINNEVIGEVY